MWPSSAPAIPLRFAAAWKRCGRWAATPRWPSAAATVDFPIDTVIFKQLRLQGSLTYTANTWDRVMKIYAQGRIRFEDLISVKLPITDWKQAFELCMDKKALKVLMYPV